MNLSDLTPIDDLDDCPFPFFDDMPQESVEKWYKIYHDGGHFVATFCERSQQKSIPHSHKTEDIDILFDSLFFHGLKQGMNDRKNPAKMSDFIRAGIVKLFPDYPDLDGYIEKKIKRKWHNLGVRKKRFRRKANLNRWNYFVTFTYDDKKHTPETFRKSLRKCLSNLHTRRNWRYMGVFECAPETGRVHFHGLLYVPDGEMIGTITEKKDYSTAQGKLQVAHINDFFADSFGRNDFTEVNEMAIKHGHTLEYLLKYIEKQGERIVYSRGIPTEICMKLPNTEIITEFTDFVTKFVLFDDVVDWEYDVMQYRKRKQMSMIDLLCNPPRVA